jgi:cell fate (sporulation/competence/biofilm development) regulator YlbF (YheA/YmcA/DUF963 family)
MADRAQVTSLDALESFRASLILFLTKARPTLEEVVDDVRRTRLWLQNDRRLHWEAELKRRLREFEQAQQELFSARLSSLHQPTAAQQLSLTRAQRAVREGEDKLRLLKKWSRDFENQADPLVKLVDHLHAFLTGDLARAVAHLTHLLTRLDAYAERGPAPGADPAAAAEPDADVGPDRPCGSAAEGASR